MAFFPLAAGATALWAMGSYSYDLKSKAEMPIELASEDAQVKDPFWGGVGPVSQLSGSALMDRATFRSVQEDVDVKGARIFLVDYGNGQRVVQYIDPRILL